MAMDIHVYDTYVKAKDGHTMHFDVITNVQDHDKAIEYAKQWLATVGEDGAKVTGEECQFVTRKEPQNQSKKKSKKRDTSFKKWKDAHNFFFNSIESYSDFNRCYL